MPNRPSDDATDSETFHPPRSGGRLRNIGRVLAVVGVLTSLILLAYWRLREPKPPVVSSEWVLPQRQAVPKLQPVRGARPAPVELPVPVETSPDPDASLRREQARQLREARLKSAIVPIRGGDTGGVDTTVPPPDTGAGGAQDANSRFARAVSGQGVAVSRAQRRARLDTTVPQGKLIEAVLEARAISDLPGMVCATVQRDVYGAQGRRVLIPWGSRICGVYSAEARKGQQRLFVVWNTLRRPDGVRVVLDSPGADQLGSAGMGGRVDSHFAEIFGLSALLSIIGAGAATVGVSNADQANSAAFYRLSVQQAAAQTSQHILQPYAELAPTITVPAGERIRLYVNRDLEFDGVEAQEGEDGHNEVIILP